MCANLLFKCMCTYCICFSFSIYYRTRWGICNRNCLHVPCVIAVVDLQVSITVIQASLGCKYDIVTLFLRIVIWWQNVLHLVHTCVLRFIVLIARPRQVLIPGVNKLFDIFDTHLMHLWTDLFDLDFAFVWSSWFRPVMKSMLLYLSLWCVCLKLKQIKIATMSQHQLIINIKQ